MSDKELILDTVSKELILLDNKNHNIEKINETSLSNIQVNSYGENTINIYTKCIKNIVNKQVNCYINDNNFNNITTDKNIVINKLNSTETKNTNLNEKNCNRKILPKEPETIPNFNGNIDEGPIAIKEAKEIVKSWEKYENQLYVLVAELTGTLSGTEREYRQALQDETAVRSKIMSLNRALSKLEEEELPLEQKLISLKLTLDSEFRELSDLSGECSSLMKIIEHHKIEVNEKIESGKETLKEVSDLIIKIENLTIENKKLQCKEIPELTTISEQLRSKYASSANTVSLMKQKLLKSLTERSTKLITLRDILLTVCAAHKRCRGARSAVDKANGLYGNNKDEGTAPSALDPTKPWIVEEAEEQSAINDLNICEKAIKNNTKHFKEIAKCIDQGNTEICSKEYRDLSWLLNCNNQFLPQFTEPDRLPKSLVIVVNDETVHEKKVDEILNDISDDNYIPGTINDKSYVKQKELRENNTYKYIGKNDSLNKTSYVNSLKNSISMTNQEITSSDNLKGTTILQKNSCDIDESITIGTKRASRRYADEQFRDITEPILSGYTVTNIENKSPNTRNLTIQLQPQLFESSFEPDLNINFNNKAENIFKAKNLKDFYTLQGEADHLKRECDSILLPKIKQKSMIVRKVMLDTEEKLMKIQDIRSDIKQVEKEIKTIKQKYFDMQHEVEEQKKKIERKEEYKATLIDNKVLKQKELVLLKNKTQLENIELTKEYILCENIKGKMQDLLKLLRNIKAQELNNAELKAKANAEYPKIRPSNIHFWRTLAIDVASNGMVVQTRNKNKNVTQSNIINQYDNLISKENIDNNLISKENIDNNEISNKVIIDKKLKTKLQVENIENSINKCFEYPLSYRSEGETETTVNYNKSNLENFEQRKAFYYSNSTNIIFNTSQKDRIFQKSQCSISKNEFSQTLNKTVYQDKNLNITESSPNKSKSSFYKSSSKKTEKNLSNNTKKIPMQTSVAKINSFKETLVDSKSIDIENSFSILENEIDSLAYLTSETLVEDDSLKSTKCEYIHFAATPPVHLPRLSRENSDSISLASEFWSASRNKRNDIDILIKPRNKASILSNISTKIIEKDNQTIGNTGSKINSETIMTSENGGTDFLVIVMAFKQLLKNTVKINMDLYDLKRMEREERNKISELYNGDTDTFINHNLISAAVAEELKKNESEIDMLKEDIKIEASTLEESESELKDTMTNWHSTSIETSRYSSTPNLKPNKSIKGTRCVRKEKLDTDLKNIITKNESNKSIITETNELLIDRENCSTLKLDLNKPEIDLSIPVTITSTGLVLGTNKYIRDNEIKRQLNKTCSFPRFVAVLEQAREILKRENQTLEYAAKCAEQTGQIFDTLVGDQLNCVYEIEVDLHTMKAVHAQLEDQSTKLIEQFIKNCSKSFD